MAFGIVIKHLKSDDLAVFLRFICFGLFCIRRHLLVTEVAHTAVAFRRSVEFIDLLYVEPGKIEVTDSEKTEVTEEVTAKIEVADKKEETARETETRDKGGRMRGGGVYSSPPLYNGMVLDHGMVW